MRNGMLDARNRLNIDDRNHCMDTITELTIRELRINCTNYDNTIAIWLASSGKCHMKAYTFARCDDRMFRMNYTYDGYILSGYAHGNGRYKEITSNAKTVSRGLFKDGTLYSGMGRRMYTDRGNDIGKYVACGYERGRYAWKYQIRYCNNVPMLKVGTTEERRITESQYLFLYSLKNFSTGSSVCASPNKLNAIMASVQPRLNMHVVQSTTSSLTIIDAAADGAGRRSYLASCSCCIVL